MRVKFRYTGIFPRFYKVTLLCTRISKLVAIDHSREKSHIFQFNVVKFMTRTPILHHLTIAESNFTFFITKYNR